MKLQFGEWLPDQPALSNPGATIAKNCIPFAKSYGQLQSLQAFTTALNSACLGGNWMRSSAGSVWNFAGTATKLYLLTDTNTWEDVTVGAGYTSAINWEFAQFGNRMIAVDINNPTQYYDAGTSTDFANLSGSPPQAKRIAVVKDFIVMGNLYESATLFPNRIRWGGFNASILWTSSVSTQADKQDLYGSGGAVERIVGGEIGTIFQEHSIRRMTYVGPPLIFRIDEVESESGTPVGNSVAWTRGAVFYKGHFGFHVFNGQSSQSIGEEKVDRWFAANSDPSAYGSMRAVVDITNRMVIWSFKSNSSLTLNDRLMIYNWSAGRWTYAEVDTECLVEQMSEDVTLEGLDALFPSGIDAQELSVDSDAYRGGLLRVTAFDSAHMAATFSGSAMTSVLETTEYSDDSGSVTHLKRARPLVDGPSAVVTMAAGTRMTQQANYSYGPNVALNAIGEASFRAKARYHRVRATIAGGFTHASGIDIGASDMRVGGRK